MMRRSSRMRLVRGTLFYLMLAVILLVTILPFLWMLSGSMHLFRTCRPSLLTCRCFTFLLFCHK